MEQNRLEQEMEINRKAFEQLREQIRRDYAGKVVALAFGRIAAIGSTVAEVNDAVNRLHPTPAHVEVFPAEAEPLFDVVNATYSEYL